MKRKWTLAASLVAAAMVTTSAWANEPGTWVLKAGPGTVMPTGDGLFVETSDLGEGGIVTNSYIEADDATGLVINATYFFEKHWAVDILGAWPFEHDAYISGDVGFVPVKVNIGTVNHLPPTVSLQYHIAPDAVIQPYVGLGANYTTFFSESVNSTAQEVGFVSFELADSWGFGFQLGANVDVGEKWLVNLDARYIQIKSKVTVTADLGDPDFVTFEVPGHLEIDPFVWSLLVGYKFD